MLHSFNFTEGNLQTNEEKFIRRFGKYLNSGGDIDTMEYANLNIPTAEGTVLHFGILYAFERIVKYTLRRGANISTDVIHSKGSMSALELAAGKYSNDPSRVSIFKMIKELSLKRYPTYKLTSLHINCALSMRYWNDEDRLDLQPANINKKISSDSPIWPGMTPILIATKFRNEDLVKALLDLGADLNVSDLEGITPFQFLYAERIYFYDERLFPQDERNSFSPITNESHFHVACRLCPRALPIVKRYLDQGISPDLPTNNRLKLVGLNLATEVENGVCYELVRLLVEYGADVNKSNGIHYAPIQYFSEHHRIHKYQDELLRCICMLIEAGALIQDVPVGGLYECFECFQCEKVKQIYFECIGRLITLSEALVSENMKNPTSKYPDKIWKFEEFIDAKYMDCCLKESKALFEFGLRPIMDDTIFLKSDFRRKFGWVVEFEDIESYPIYKDLLMIKTKRKLREYDTKNSKIQQTIPFLQFLFKKFVYLPNLCAEMILWNLNVNELTQLDLAISNIF